MTHYKDDKSIARKTGYKGGKPLRNSIVTRHLMCAPFSKESKILDYGAGYKATQSQILSTKYPKIKAYDFPETMEDSINDAPDLKKFFTTSPRGSYDIVLASNVLNVQQTLPTLQNTINEIYCNMKKGSTLVVNIPKDPIKFIPEDTTCCQKGKRVAKHGALTKVIKDELSQRFGRNNITKIKKICGKRSKSLLLEVKKSNKTNEDIFCIS